MQVCGSLKNKKQMNAMLIHTTPVDETEGKPKICVRKMLF